MNASVFEDGPSGVKASKRRVLEPNGDTKRSLEMLPARVRAESCFKLGVLKKRETERGLSSSDTMLSGSTGGHQYLREVQETLKSASLYFRRQLTQ
jgi:isocitrate/isopropylmalate dehydrogenase